MGSLIDLTGQKFNRLTVIERDTTYNKCVKWICKCDCGNITSVRGSSLKSGHVKSCGCYTVDSCKARSGENHARWKGGVIDNGHGYNVVLDKSHPNARKNGYVLEHVYVMSKHLGRPLSKHEFVHHKDGNKKNNDISNLELWSTYHPSGQRVEDLLEFAWNIISAYDPAYKYQDTVFQSLQPECFDIRNSHLRPACGNHEANH